MKNKEIIGIINQLNARAQREHRAIEHNPDAERFDINATYIIHKNKKELEDKLTPYNTSLDELMRQYDIKVNAEGAVDLKNITEDKRKEFLEKLNKLKDIEVKVDITKISINALGVSKLSSEDMEALAFMIES